MDTVPSPTTGPHEGRNGTWSEMDAHIMEIVFSKLPESCVVRATSVCKRWQALARAPTFTHFYAQQEDSSKTFCFVVKGVRYSFTEHGRLGFALQSEESSFCVPTFSCPEDGQIPSLEGAGGLHYAFTGMKQTRVVYKLCLLDQTWKYTSNMPYRMQDPIVGAVKDPSDPHHHKLVFAGGVTDILEDDDDLAVSIYDSRTNTWEACDPLPVEFRGSTSSLFMAAVVHGERFFAYDMFSGFVCELDMQVKKWLGIQTLHPLASSVNQLFLVQSGELRLVSIQNADERDFCFNVWSVSAETMQLRELLHTTTVCNVRAAPPSAIARWASGALDSLARSVGVLLIVLIHFMFMCHALTTRTVCLLRLLNDRANVRLSASFESFPALRRSGTKTIEPSRSRPTRSVFQILPSD